MANLLDRDDLFTQEMVRETVTLGLQVIEVRLAPAVEDLARVVSEALHLGTL